MFADIQAAFIKGEFDVALQKIAAFRTKTNNRDFPAIIYLEGACHFNLQKFKEAATFFQKFVDTFPAEPSFNDALMALGESYLHAGASEKGIEVLRKAAAVEDLRDRAGLMIASHYKKAGKANDALQILEVILKDQKGAPTQEQQHAILMASDIYVGKQETDKASALMERLRAGTNGAESIVELNILGQKVGDSMLEASRYGEALRAYQSMRRHGELLRLQKQRIGFIEGWIATITAGGRVQFMGKLLSKDEADAMLAQNKKVLDEITNVKDYDANIFYRLGQCFYEMKRFHEAILAFKEIHEKHKSFPGRDGALFGMIASNQQLERYGRAYALCEVYMKDFPDGKFIADVTQMFGKLAYDSGNLAAAEASLQRVVSSAKDPEQKAALTFLMGVVHFEGRNFEAARGTFQVLVSDHKDAVQRPVAQYYIALSYFFQNDSKNARRALKEYIGANPEGDYLVDARYRLAFIEVQDGNAGEVMGDLVKLTEESPHDPNIAQVWSLLGDIYANLKPTEEEQKKGVDYVGKTLEAYRHAVDKAMTLDVRAYAIENATNLMVEKGMWPDIADMWREFYEAEAGKPEALKAIYWITRAKEREARDLTSKGKHAEARAAEQEARGLVVRELAPHLGNPGNEQVEVLIQQLATMMVPKRRPKAVAPSAASVPAASATPAPEVTLGELDEEFKRLLTPVDTPINGTTNARLLYGRALIARLMKDAGKYESYVSLISDAARPEEMSPLLLATLGELMLKKGDFERATVYFEQLRTKYPKSEFGDRAPAGLGEIAYQRKDYDKALELYTEAVEKYSMSEESMLNGTLGRAKVLLAKSRWDEAIKIYTTIMNTRNWRIAMPEALFGLGQAYEGKGEPRKSIDLYRRIIISNRRDKSILAKAYLQAARCYLQIEDNQNARTTLVQMLGKADIADQPERAQGDALLDQVGR